MKKRRGVFGHTYRSSCGGKKRKRKEPTGEKQTEKRIVDPAQLLIFLLSLRILISSSLNSHSAPLFFFFFLLFSFCRLFTIGLTPCCIRRHIYIRPCIYSTNELKIKNREIGPSCWAIQTTTSIVSLSVKLPV